jgi:hypothetical protein
MADHPLSPTIPVFQPGGVNQGGKGIKLIKLPGVAVSLKFAYLSLAKTLSTDCANSSAVFLCLTLSAIIPLNSYLSLLLTPF